MINSEEAKQQLVEGNKRFIGSIADKDNKIRNLMRKTAEEGQHPYAIVVTCADSRVIPELIFNANIGDLFVIRVAGNVISDNQLGSIEYAADHLNTKLVVVLGHTNCGAVSAAIQGSSGRFTESIIRDISAAIGFEKNDYAASCLNIRNSVKKIHEAFCYDGICAELSITGAIYDIEIGEVHYID